MKNIVLAWVLLLAQAPQDRLLGTWTGQVRYGDETKSYALRIEAHAKYGHVVYFTVPDMRFYDVGPFPLRKEGDDYKGDNFRVRLSADGASLAGTMSFDGHDLAFEGLERGEALAKVTPPPPAGRVAKPTWTFKAGGAIWSSPTVADGNVYFGSNDANVYAVEAASGKLVWKYKTGGAVMGQPTLDGAHLYALSDDGNLYKLDRKSGKLVWRFDTHGGSVARDMPSLKSATFDYLASAPAFADGVVYVGSADKRLYAVDAKTGQERWHFDTKGMVRSTPALAGGLIYFGSYDNHVYAVDAKTGALVWTLDTLEPVVSSPLVAGGTVYIGSRSSDLFALDAATGKVKWKYFYWASWVESSARMSDGVLYVGSSDHQRLFAIDAATGKRIWKADTDGSSWSSPAVAGDRVFVGATGSVGYFIPHHGGFFAFDRATGDVVWRFPMSEMEGAFNYGVASSPAVDGGLVYFGGLDGVFYAFRTEG